MANKEQRAWYFYDWANSAFYTTVATVFLGPYLTTIAKNAADIYGFVYPFGIKVKAGSFFPYVVSASVFFQMLLLPVLGAIADYSNKKKFLLGFFAYTGSLSTMLLYFLNGTNYLFGGMLFITANLSFGASIVFYNAFLPEISTPEERDSVSSKGWALGYLGGGILLALNLVLYSHAKQLGLSIQEAVRISLASAGSWWAVFTIIPLISLKNRRPFKTAGKSGSYIRAGLTQLLKTLGGVKNYPQTFLFLLAYLIYNDGIQSVIVLSSQFGQEELGLSMQTLTTVILMVQFVAFFGAVLFGFIAKRTDAKTAVIYTLIIWTLALIYAYAFLKTTFHFYILAAIIAVIMGGSQALSRSIYSKMIPEGRESEYFSLYEISERGTSWLGPLFFGLAIQFTGSYRIGILSLVIFFVLGLLLLLKVNVREAISDANKSQLSSDPGSEHKNLMFRAGV